MNAVSNEDADPDATATVPLHRPAPRPATAETGFLLRLAHARATEQIAAALPAGLLPRHHEVLAALAELGSRSQQQLAERLGINRTIMVSLIDSMEQAGLVERNRDPADRRSYAITPTAEGGRALAEMERAADRADAQLTASLADREQRQLERLLRTLASTGGGLDQRPAALTRRTIDLLSLAHHCVSQTFAQRLEHAGLTPPLYGTLKTLDATGRLRSRRSPDSWTQRHRDPPNRRPPRRRPARKTPPQPHRPSLIRTSAHPTRTRRPSER